MPNERFRLDLPLRFGFCAGGFELDVSRAEQAEYDWARSKPAGEVVQGLPDEWECSHDSDAFDELRHCSVGDSPIRTKSIRAVNSNHVAGVWRFEVDCQKNSKVILGLTTCNDQVIGGLIALVRRFLVQRSTELVEANPNQVCLADELLSRRDVA